jgi:acyl-[acyl-carrier-protein]-phospholipid O-acyltransferase/long-chain-fatty-acid--[acyl-carrier-protein] ligase
MNTEVFGYTADKGFTVMGTLTLMVSITLLFQFFDYLSRFLGMVLSRIHFKTTFNGTENIPDTPAIYICTHNAWNDTLLMLGAQRRRMRFFIEKEQEHSRWLKRMYHLLRVVNIPEPLENSPECLEEVKASLRKGISVCVFVNNPDICHEFYKLLSSYTIQEVLKDLKVPVIPVSIEKGTKKKEPRFFKRVLEKLFIPAKISFGSLVCKV